MADIHGKLKQLEQRAKSLENVYEGLLERAADLEKRSRQCEAKYQLEKKSFDLVEMFMKQDGRSKAMFDHVSLFFYVLLTKLHRKGIDIRSTTELWSRLQEQEVKTAYEETISNLGFTQKEINALNLILDVLHEKDLTVYVNQSKVDSSNLTQNLHDLNEEFWIDEGRNDTNTGGTSGSTGSHLEPVKECGSAHATVFKNDDCAEGGVGVDLKMISETADKTDLRHKEACYPDGKPGVPVSQAECGDTVSVDSLLLYLNIQRELDPLVTSALRRAVAIAHCSLVKSPRPEVNASYEDKHEFACDNNEGTTEEDQSTTEMKGGDTNYPLDGKSSRQVRWTPPLQLTEEIKASIPEGCGALFFSDSGTSFPEIETETTE